MKKLFPKTVLCSLLSANPIPLKTYISSGCSGRGFAPDL